MPNYRIEQCQITEKGFCIGNQNSNWVTDKEGEFITWLFIVYLNPFCILTFEKSSKIQR